MTPIRGIYALLDKKTSKLYIGSSKSIVERVEQHFKDLKRNKHGNIKLQRVYNKGRLILPVIIEITSRDLFDREQYWMEYYDSVDELNISEEANRPSGTEGMKFGKIPKSRSKKISESVKKTLQDINIRSKMRKPRSKEFRKTMSEVAKRRVITKETRRRMSLSHIGKHYHGGKRSEADKLAISKGTKKAMTKEVCKMISIRTKAAMKKLAHDRR